MLAHAWKRVWARPRVRWANPLTLDLLIQRRSRMTHPGWCRECKCFADEGSCRARLLLLRENPFPHELCSVSADPCSQTRAWLLCDSLMLKQEQAPVTRCSVLQELALSIFWGQRNAIHFSLFYPCHFSKKSLPLSSTTMKAGKSSTSIFQTASIPSSSYSSTETFLMQFWARIAAGPPIDPR